MINRYAIIAVLFSILAIASCKQERPDCMEPTLVSLRFTAMSTHTVINTGVTPPDTARVSFDTVLPNARLIPLDDSIKNIEYTFGYSANFSLLLNPNQDSCRWVLSQVSDTTIIDTITFYYTRKLQFLSNACGYTYYFNLTKTPSTPNLKNNVRQNILDTLHHCIDSILVTNAAITNDVNQQHLQIYIHNPF